MPRQRCVSCDDAGRAVAGLQDATTARIPARLNSAVAPGSRSLGGGAISCHASRMTSLDELQDHVLADQYDWGEFGRSEVSDRSETEAYAKPNLFVSCHAAYALVATGARHTARITRFLDWIRAIRSPDGWWTSAAGAVAPRGTVEPATVRNIRHTAKGLDLMALRGELVATDAAIVRDVLATQTAGGWPALPGGTPEVWGTAYVLNLIAQLLRGRFAWLSPTAEGVERWNAQLRNQLAEGVNWLAQSLGPDSLWRVSPYRGHQSREHGLPLFTTEAVLTEVGALLAQMRPDVCEPIARALLTALDSGARGVRGPTTLWGLGLIWPALDTDTGRRTRGWVSPVLDVRLERMDVVDLACLCRLKWIDRDFGLLAYLSRAAGYHESVLQAWAAWARDDYERWSVRQAQELESKGVAQITGNPRSKTEGWLAVLSLLARWKEYVEESGGWHNLWSGHTHVSEAVIQENFRTFAAGYRDELHSIVLREPQTGRGPVDFLFTNGAETAVYLEFKRLDHARLEHGARVQLPTYMRAGGVDSAIFVCVGFDDDDLAAFERVKEAMTELESIHADLFVRAVSIDARPKPSASRA